MMGVAVHEAGTDEGTREEWVAKSKKFGFAVTANGAAIARNEIERVASLPGGPMPNPQKVLSKTKENIKLQELNTKMTQMITAGPYLSKIVKTK